MKKLYELRQQKQALFSEMKALVDNAENEKRNLTTEEDAKFKALQKEIEEAISAIQRAEILDSHERGLIGGNRENSKMPSNAELRAFINNPQIHAASIGTPSEGGYTVVPELDRTIYALLRDNSVFRQNANIQTISGQTYEKLVSVGGTTAAWAAESDTRNATNTSALEKIEISLNSLYAYPATSQELLDMSDFDIAGWITSEVALQSGEVEDEALWNGDGVKKPKGLMTYPTAATADNVRAFGTIEEFTTASSGAVTADELITFIHKLREGYRGNARFYMSDSMFEIIRKLKDADGNYLLRPGLMENAPMTLLGKPVALSERLAIDSIVYGDLSRAYTVLDHTSGVRMLRDNITSPGSVKMFTTRYVGGGLVDSNAVKFLKLAA